MKRGLTEADEAFSAVVHAFVDRHWDGVSEAQRVTHWYTAARAAGWGVPMWPATAGGPGWNATRKYLWSQILVRRGVLLPPSSGIDVVGPLLMAVAPETMQVKLLPGIRDGATTWCVGAAEADGLDLGGMQTTAFRVADGFELRGRKHFVWGAGDAEWMLCIARLNEGYGLFALPLDDQAVGVSEVPTFDGGAALAEIELSNVFVPAGLGCAIADPEAALRKLGGVAPMASGALAEAQLTAIREVTAAWQDDNLDFACGELGVAVEALKAMEARYVEAEARGARKPFPAAALRARSREILLQLGDLQLSSFGYYALPYPDEALLHNEGPIGPAGTTAAVRRNLAARLALQHEAVTSRVEDWKDEIARHLDVAEEEQQDSR